MAAANLRFGLSTIFGWPFSRWSLDAMVKAMRETWLERGRLGDDSDELLSGPELDDDMRAFVQGRRFRAQARRALGTPYYRAVFEREGIDPARLDHRRIGTVPLTPKQALRDDPDAFVHRRARPAQRVVSTGTTGVPTAIWLSEREAHLLGAFTAIAYLVRGTVLPDDVVLVAISSRAQLAAGSGARAATALGAAHHVAGLVDPEQTLALLAAKRRLPGHKPRTSVLSTYPSYLGLLVEAAPALGYGPEDFSVERVLLGGEVATTGLRDRARKLLGDQVEFVEGYGMTETVPVSGAPCSQGHLHYEPVVGVVEVLGLEEDGPAAPGEPGSVVATPLPPFRQTTIVLRFDTGDVVPTFAGRLTCERAGVPATGRPSGKLRHAVRHDHGWTFTRDVAEALEAVQAVPLPARYGFRAAGGAVEVEVLARSTGATARRSIASALEERRVPLAGLRVVDDPADLAAPLALRCDLRELTFTATTRGGS